METLLIKLRVWYLKKMALKFYERCLSVQGRYHRGELPACTAYKLITLYGEGVDYTVDRLLEIKQQEK